MLVLLLLAASVALLRRPETWDAACTLARRELPGLTGLEVGIGRCELDPLAQTLRLRGLSLFVPGTDTPLFAADLAEVQLGFVSPFSGRLPVSRVRVDRPRVSLDLAQARTAPAAATGAPAAPTCPLQQLERLRVGRLDIRDAELRVALPKGRRVEVGGVDLDWRERWGAAEFDLEAREGRVRLGEAQGPELQGPEQQGPEELVLGRLVLSGLLDPDEALLEVDRGELAVEDVTLSLSGKVEELCSPVLDLDVQAFVPLRTVARIAALPRPAEGHVWARVGLKGRPEHLSASADVSTSGLAYGAYAPGSLTARLSYGGELLRVEELVVPAGAGKATVRGELRLTPGLPTQATLEAEGASLARVLEKAGLPGAWVDFPATGTARVAGTLLPRPQLHGDLDLRTGPFRLATRPFDQPSRKGLELLHFERGHVRAQLNIGPDQVRFGALSVETAKSRVQGEATLYYEPSRGLDVRGKGELDLADFGMIAELPWSGRGGAEFEVTGPYSDVRVGAALSLRDFVFWGFGLGVVQGRLSYADGTLAFPHVSGQKGRTPYTGGGALTFGPTLHTRGRIEVQHGRTEDLVDLVAGLSPSLALMQGTLGGTVSGKVAVEGPADHFGGGIELALQDTTYYGRRMGNGTARLRFVDGKALAMERTVLEGPLGRTWAEGTFTFLGGGLDYRYGGEKLSLPELVGPEQAARLGIEGTLALEGEVGGNADLPTASGRLSAPNIRFAQRDLGPLSLEGRMVGKDFQLWGKPARDANGFVRVKLREPFPYDASLTLTLPEIRPLLPAVAAAQGLSGSVSGVISAQGNFRDPADAQVGATFERLRLSRGDFAGENDGPVVLTFSRGRLDLQAFTFRGPNTELAAAGWVGPERLDLSMRGAMDVRLLESFVPGLERTGGTLELNAVASGPLQSPTLMGSAELRDAKLALRDQALSVRGLNGRLEFTEHRVLLEDLQGQLNEGRVAVRGDVRLERFEPQQLELGLQLTDVAFRPTEDLPLTASGELLLSGKPDALLLTGDLEVVRLRYQKGLELDALLQGLGRRSVLSASSVERPREYLTLDVKVHLGDVRVDNNLARAKLLGDLRLTGTNTRLGLLGTLEAAEGSRAFFRNNEFAITQGVLEFKDRYAIDPVFDLHATTQVRDHLVKLHGFGRIASPQVLLASEPDLPEGDILSLLTLGVMSRDKEATAATGASLAAEALFNVSGLDRQVQRFLPKNPLLRDLSFQISTAYNASSSQVEPTAQLESKFLTEQLKLTMQQPVSGRGTRARAEYRFDNRLSTQAQWDNEHSDAAFGNLGLELKLSWQVE
nr:MULTISPECIES: translocation/assembly module TamB domain-containing protein [Myxococcaceae]